MKKHHALVYLIALATLGSGLFNIFSVIGPSLPGRMAQLQHLFPLEFAHLSRFLTLLIGFSLTISSINIFKRKERAFQLVFILSVLSVIFHLTKGLDYEEAILSFILLLMLIFTRKRFTVKSSIPNLHWGLLRFAMALLVTIAYGVSGFWFLDQKDFDVNFHLGDAIRETFLFLLFFGDANLVPHTRYAHWFLDSLYVISIIGITYALFALFRPVRYRLMTLPRERVRAREILEKYGRHSIDYFKLWHDKSYFFSPTNNSFLAYRVGANFAVVLADPVGPEEEIEDIIRRFMIMCEENDWGIAFHQTLPDFLPIYEKLGFKELKIGDEAIIDLTRFTLSGKGGREFRYAVNKMENLEIHTEYYEPPIPNDVLKQAKEVSDDWLQIEGRRERSFTLGLFDPNYVRSTPIFAAVDKDGKIQGFVNLIPSYKKGEATIDLMRRRSDSPNGLMDYVFIKLFLYLQGKGYQTFNLGLAAMSGFQKGEEASPEERAIDYFFQHANFLFSFN
jgi:phosphatidylglycerol lysyltransferase